MKQSVKNSRIIGIDLGTANSLACFLDSAGQARPIPAADGDLKMPSVVYAERGEVLVGNAARNMQVVSPGRVVFEFKRDVGTDKTYFTDGNITVTPGWCQTQVIKELRKAAIKYFDDDRAASQAVITVPAYFKERERQSVKQSAEQAGIEVLGLINEPTAAGLAYGIHEKQGDCLLLIPDFGGGTYDVSIINFAGGEAKVLASFGDLNLGGKNVDDVLIKLVQDGFKKEHGLELTAQSHPADWYAIRDEVIRQKHMLSSRTEVKLCARVDGRQVVVPVTRETLRGLLKPLLDKIVKVTLETIELAKVNRQEIKHVLRVGGSSRLIAFEETMKELVGTNCFLGGQVSPDLAVAEGAIIQAAKLVSATGRTMVNESLLAIPMPSIKHTDVMPHSLGVGVQDRVSSAIYCSVILERNRPIPCTEIKTYGSVDDQQTRFKVDVLQGEEGQPLSDCLVVGERELELPARSSAKPSIEVSMGYDVSGMCKLTVKDLISQKVEDIRIDFYAKATTECL